MIARTSTLLALAALVAGCGTETLKKDQLDGFVEKTAKDLGVKVKSVECPDDVEGKKGESFECTVKARGGKEAEITVEQTSDDGNVLVDPRELAALLGKGGDSSGARSLARVQVDKVEREISKRVSSQSKGEITASSVACPDDVPVKAGKKFTCKVTSEDGKTTEFTVTWTDEQGSASFEGNLDALAP